MVMLSGAERSEAGGASQGGSGGQTFRMNFSEIDAYVGRRIRERREALGISQGRLGRDLGLTFSQVQKYEKGMNRVGAGRLYALSILLDVPVQYFFDGLDKSGNVPAPETRPSIDPAEAARLQEAFRRIADPAARRALLSLVSSLVES